MKVYLKEPAGLSRAMRRVTNALEQYAPTWVETVHRPEDADLQMLHVIASDAITYESKAKLTATIQYCYKTAGGTLEQWMDFWQRQALVWSYYPQLLASRHYCSPLGIDLAFRQPINFAARRHGLVMTTGYVAGRQAEAIEEVALAALRLGHQPVHLGPMPVGIKSDEVRQNLRTFFDLTDAQLRKLYQSMQFVSGLRHVEGFEMPVIEGLACGARPIVFDRLEMRQWFEDFACFVPEGTSEEITAAVHQVLQNPRPVTKEERDEAIYQFSWERVVTGFWNKLREAL